MDLGISGLRSFSNLIRYSWVFEAGIPICILSWYFVMFYLVFMDGIFELVFLLVFKKDTF